MFYDFCIAQYVKSIVSLNYPDFAGFYWELALIGLP